MGYTHYWSLRRNFSREQWAEIVTDCQAIVHAAVMDGVALALESDSKEPPFFDERVIRFNGVGEEGHDTFLIRRTARKPEYVGDTGRRDFSKTEHKPYDLAVTAILAYLDLVYPENFSVSSDGRTAEWDAGVALARRAVPRYGNVIATPRDVIETSRYRSYYQSGNKYQLALGHDGVIYIERHKDKRRAALPIKPDDWHDWYKANERPNRRWYGSFTAGEHDKLADAMLEHIWKTFGANAIAPEIFKPIPA